MRIKKCFVVFAAMVLLVSVFSVGGFLSAEGTEKDIGLLVYRRGPGSETGYFRENPGYEVIEEYDSFILIETSEEKVASLEDKNYMLERLDNRDHVGLQSHSFRTTEGEPEISDELKIDEYPEEENGYYIVQFAGPIRPEWKERLEEEGVILHEFRQRFNFIVEMDPETKEDVEGLDFVNWVGIYQPAYRFDEELLERSDPIYLDVSLFEGANPGLVANDIEVSGARVHYVGEDRINVEVEAEEIVNLANLEGVKAIGERNPERRLFNSRATWVTQTNEEDNRKVTEMGVTGEGELITVMDSGLFPEHEAFNDPDNEIGDDHRKIQARYVPEGARGDVDAEMGHMHGTHVTGTVLGQSPPYDEYSNQDGNAMDARVVLQDVSEDGMSISPPPDMYSDAYGDVYDMAEGSRVHTNSWGSVGASGEYTNVSQEADQFIWDHKDFNILFAAGNDGDEAYTVSPEASGKNVIGVGATQGGDGEPIDPRGATSSLQEQEQDNVAGLSSRGYAADGRIKPDIMHVGDGLISASFEGPEEYMPQSGTSMSCPGIAGQMGQVRQYYEEGWYPTGEASPEDGFNPSSALVRATLINGAIEISGEGSHLNDQRFPNNDQGFGRSKLDRALHFEGDERNLITFDSWLGSGDRGVELETGESWDMEFEVEDPSQELEVTLAWTDPPGPLDADEANPALVNDLDLELQGPDGTRYVGNAFTDHDPGYSEPDPEENHWSGLREEEFDGLNVIQDTLLLPDHNDIEEGTYEVSVTANNVPEDRQDFAVVISGGVEDEEIGETPEAEVHEPQGGEEFDAYDEVDIEWDASAADHPLDMITLDYSVDGGDSWEYITSIDSEEDPESYTWTVPNEHSDESLIRVSARDEGYMIGRAYSDPFSIEGIPPEPPEGLEVELSGEDYSDNSISWQASDDDPEEVSHYNLYRSEDQDGPWDEIEEVLADGSASYNYIDEGSGVADGTVWWYLVRAVGENGLEEENENAVQQPDEVELTIDAEEGGTTDPEPGVHTYEIGEEVTITAEPDDGWKFSHWEGDHTGTEEEITIEMNSYKSITAHFEEVYELSIDVEGEGNVYLDDEEIEVPYEEEFEEDAEMTLLASAEEGWYFDTWTGDHEADTRQISIEMNEDKEITAVFERITHDVEITDIEGEGTIEVDGETVDLPYAEEYEDGSEVEFKALSAEGWKFVEWSGDHPEGESEEEEITIEVDGDKSISASFERREYELVIGFEGEGHTYPREGEHTYEYGEEVEIEANPDSDWVFTEWTGDIPEDQKEEAITTITIEEDKEITATFLRAAHFEVRLISPEEGDEFDAGEEITVGYEVENTGDVEGTHEVEFYVDGSLIDSEMVTLDGGETDEGEFRWEGEEDGDFEFVLRSIDDQEQEESSSAVTISVEDTALYLWLGIGIAIVIVVAIAGIYMKKGGNIAGEDEEYEEEE